MRLSAFGVEHVGKAFAVNAAGVARRLGRRPDLPFLHPGHAPGGALEAPQHVADAVFAANGNGPDRARHMLYAVKHNPEHPPAPAHVRNALSGNDLSETLGRLGRATRRQDKEFIASVHPISGRVMTLNRGGSLGAQGNIHRVDRTRERAADLAARTKNPQVRERAEHVVRGTGGPQPVVVHNHPPLGAHGETRHYQSGTDVQAGHQMAGAGGSTHSVVLSRREGTPLARRTVATHLYVDHADKDPVAVHRINANDVATQTHDLRRRMPEEDRDMARLMTSKVRSNIRREGAIPATGNQYAAHDRGVRRETTGRQSKKTGMRTVQTFHKADTRRRKAAHGVEVAGSVTAGTVGTAAVGAKLRDSFAEDHEAAFDRGMGRLHHATQRAHAGPKTTARIMSVADEGSKLHFKPLAVATVAGGTAALARHYGKHLDRRQHKAIRTAAPRTALNPAPVSKTAPRLLPVRAKRNTLYPAKHAAGSVARTVSAAKVKLVPRLIEHSSRLYGAADAIADFAKADTVTQRKAATVAKSRKCIDCAKCSDPQCSCKGCAGTLRKSAFGVDHEIAKLGLGGMKVFGADALKGAKVGARGGSFGAAPGTTAGMLGAKAGNTGFKAGQYTRKNLKPIGIGAGAATGVVGGASLLNRNN